MKNQLKNFKILVLVGLLTFAPAYLDAQNKKTFRISTGTTEVSKNNISNKDVTSRTRTKPEEDLDELNFIEMVNSVPLDSKSAELIRKFQEKEGRNRLFGKEYNAKNECTVETFRNKEVLLITIPASKLFAPNDTVLREGAETYLSPIKRYLKDPDMYRVLMVMHTDNTGSEQYRDNLTEARSTAVADWFEDQNVDTSFLFPYSFGDDMPLVENNSMSNRERNRRLEIYLVPGKKMLQQAKKGRIVF